jgi:hypothetical protein
MRMNKALKGRHRFLADYAKACVALSGLNLNSILKPRVPEPAVRAPPPWALLHRAFSALGLRLSSTRMPSGVVLLTRVPYLFRLTNSCADSFPESLL